MNGSLSFQALLLFLEASYPAMFTRYFSAMIFPPQEARLQKQHLSLIERPCTLKFITIARFSIRKSFVLAPSSILFITVSLMIS